MTCQYCRAQIELDAHRCTRCGRRTMDRTPVQMTAAVPSLETVEMPIPVPTAPRPQLVTEPPKRAEHPTGPGFQANLFGLTEAGRPAADNVVSGPAQRRKRGPGGGAGAGTQRPTQQALNFQVSPVTSSVYCDNPVALAAHRMMAATIDMALAIAALAVFLFTFQFAGAELALNKVTSPYYVAAAVLICIFYRALFCIANIDTPGVRWTGLRVVDFDGRRPSRKHRWYRLLGGCVSAVPAGIGLLWSVVDEEHLTWHDHISKTFPTPRFL